MRAWRRAPLPVRALSLLWVVVALYVLIQQLPALLHHLGLLIEGVRRPGSGILTLAVRVVAGKLFLLAVVLSPSAPLYWWIWKRAGKTSAADGLPSAELIASMRREAARLYGDAKLTYDPIPRRCSYHNVRELVTPDTWNRIRRRAYRRAGFCCEVCGGRGEEHPVECHEIWWYDLTASPPLQRLGGLTALCPRCHAVKHLNNGALKDRREENIEWLCRVNGWSRLTAESYIILEDEICKKLSEYPYWDLDIGYLDYYLGLEELKYRGFSPRNGRSPERNAR